MFRTLIGVAVVLSACGRAMANFIPNGSLDQQSQGQVDGWTFAGKDGAKAIPTNKPIGTADAKVSRVKEPDGRYLLRLETDGKKGNESVYVNSHPFVVPTGFTYEFTCDYRAKGLLNESGGSGKSSFAEVSLLCLKDGKPLRTNNFLGTNTISSVTSTPDWTDFTRVSWTGEYYGRIVVPKETQAMQIKTGIRNMYPDNPVRADFRGFTLKPVDFTLPNGNFEETDAAGALASWAPFGSTQAKVVSQPVHGGSKAIEVKDAPPNIFSGWATVVPVRPDREYVLRGFVKVGDVAAGGPLAGALSMQFLDRQGKPLGEPVYSNVPTGRDWTEVATPKVTAPPEALTARLIAGMQYCSGSTWFDDVALEMSPVAVKNAVKVLRPDPKPSARVVYSKNLLKNGDVESTDGSKPVGWTYVGKSETDWTEQEVNALYANGRPVFNVGRGKGELSRAIVYQGKGALLNRSVDPPLSKRHQWYGRNPVDGYWFSDAMACEPGKAYMAGAWIRPGDLLSGAWYGPLEIQFFDQRGQRVALKPDVRGMLNAFPANEWNYWFTTPHVAPAGAATMRLRFGQELAADKGGWGSTYADNLAVWEVPAGADADMARARHILNDNLAARAWFSEAHAKLKPPYLPSPEMAAEYQSVWGSLENSTPGNILGEAKADVKLRFMLFNSLGEDRKLSVKGVRTDWNGKASEPFVSPSVVVSGFSRAQVEVTLPATGEYGAFHLECDLMEGNAKVGQCTGRYAVIPPLERKRTQENIWGVTLLRWDTSPFEADLPAILKTGGFGLAWVRDYGADNMAGAIFNAEFYRSLGMKVVLQVQPQVAGWMPKPESECDPKPYYEYGRQIATTFKGKVVAYGDWGIEQANNRTAEKPVYRPIKDGKFMDDREYDRIYVAIHDGLRSVDKDTPILIGNIATDVNSNAIKRMYGEPVKGRFDGAILNAYYNMINVSLNAIAEFDKHGDTRKTVWQEENADQRSPIAGPGRRYGEREGAINMVRSWITLACKAHPRIRSVTQWGFVAKDHGPEADICMMDIGLQPRPQYVAHAVMADALADAEYQKDLSNPAMGIFEFQRAGKPFFVAWATAGERELTLTADGDVSLMDIMGNRQTVKAVNGAAEVRLTTSPLYIDGATRIAAKR